MTLTVLVTGGAAGIGRAIVKRYVDEGARVHFSDINQEAIEQTLSDIPTATASLSNMGQQADVETLAQDAFEQLSHIDVLINNAGIGGERGAVEDLDPLAWEECLRVNLTGPFLLMQQIIPDMKKRQAGCIVNISTASVRTKLPFRAPYVASKGGLISLSENVAREVGKWNIRCNAILPGIIHNERGNHLIEKFGNENGLSFEEAKEKFLSYISMRTMIEPEDIANTCWFLSSPAGAKISGQSIGVDGNMEWEA
ncbi:MAG: SDR family oxidoreductase [Pseudomonadota bacterium]